MKIPKNLIHQLIHLMKRAETVKYKEGAAKKEWVMKMLKSYMKYDEDLEDLIMEFIDYLIMVDKGKIRIRDPGACCYWG